MKYKDIKSFVSITGCETEVHPLFSANDIQIGFQIGVNNIRRRKGISEGRWSWFQVLSDELTDESFVNLRYTYNMYTDTKETNLKKCIDLEIYMMKTIEEDKEKKENQITATMWRYDDSMNDKAFTQKALEALTKVSGSDCGTISNPSEIASMILDNREGKTVIQKIQDGEDVEIADGYFSIDIRPSERFIYTDVAMNLKEAGIDVYRFETNCQDEDLMAEDSKEWARGMYEVKAEGEVAVYCKTREQAEREQRRENHHSFSDDWKVSYIPTIEENEKNEREAGKRLESVISGDLFGILAEIGVHFMESYQTDLLWDAADIIHHLTRFEDVVLFVSESHADLIDRYRRILDKEDASIDECLAECQKTLGADYVITLHPDLKVIDIRILKEERQPEYKAECFKNSIFRGLDINITK